MILYLGDKETFDYLATLTNDISAEISIDEADKIIVLEYSHTAVSLIREAEGKNIPVLGILDGFRSVAEAMGAELITIENCPEGKQELCVLDTDSPLHHSLPHVTSVCRGSSEGIDEERFPDELMAIARAETGEIIAFSKNTDQEFPHIYGVNYYITSGLTLCKENIINNFINL